MRSRTEAGATFIVVLTGGIASGKTTVSDRFAELGAAIVDTDVLARKVVEPGSSVLRDIAERFGDRVLDEDGSLNRRRMRQLVFADEQCKESLEAIIHPAIRLAAKEEIARARGLYCVLVVPLLAESGGKYPGDRVLVVDVDEEVQIERVMERDQIERGEAEAILRIQASRTDRLALADDVIVNDGSFEALTNAVDALHHSYLAFAADKRNRSQAC